MSDDRPIRVVLADDHTMVRAALARVLEDSGKICVVAQAEDGPGAIAAVRTTRPHVLVIDYSMSGSDAPEVIESLLPVVPDLKVLVLTVHENVHYAVRVLENGAHGYLVKSAAVEELVAAIEAVRLGRIYLSASVSQEVLRHMCRPRRERVGLESLSPREFDFLRIVASGKSLQDCAEDMKVSVSTASTYRSRVMEKLSLRSTAELIRFALEHDIVG